MGDSLVELGDLASCPSPDHTAVSATRTATMLMVDAGDMMTRAT